MIKFVTDCNPGVTAIHQAIYLIGREYGSPVADSGPPADFFTLIVGEAWAMSAQRAITDPQMANYRIRLIIMPQDLWPEQDRWCLARKGGEGAWSNGV